MVGIYCSNTSMLFSQSIFQSSLFLHLYRQTAGVLPTPWQCSQPSPNYVILSHNPLWLPSWFMHWKLQFAVINQGWTESSSKHNCSGKLKEQRKYYLLKYKKQVLNLHKERARCRNRNPQQTISLCPHRLQLWLVWTAPRTLPRLRRIYSNGMIAMVWSYALFKWYLCIFLIIS